MGYIYKIINDINDCVYVGQTIRKLAVRWREHKKIAKQSPNTRTSNPLYNAMRKYGVEHFQLELIEEVENEKLNDREIYWIDFYNSYRKGYNATHGGVGHKKPYTLVKDRSAILQLWGEGYNITTIGKKLGHRPEVVRKVLEIDYQITSEEITKQRYLKAQKEKRK